MIRNPILPFVTHQGLFILDGGLATELEYAGHNLNDPLWSARLLLENPEALRQVHHAYLAAGADCIASASYQATIPGLIARGLSASAAADLLRFSVQLAIEVRDVFWNEEANRVNRLRPLVAASIGPYGAYLANGAEYTGDYNLDAAQLTDWHRERWHILAASSADLLACETTPSRAEAQAYATLLAETPQMPAWISFSCRDEQHISDGTPLADVAALLDTIPNVVAIGVNCTPPRLMPPLITAVAQASHKLILVYPNSGEGYDVATRSWIGDTEPSAYGTISREWRKLGAVGIGGCCRTRPSHIQQLRDRVRLNT
jgi:homocysteine S-methyltransferase